MTEESVTKVAVCGNKQFTDPVDDVPLDGPVLSVVKAWVCEMPRAPYVYYYIISTETIAHSRPVVAGMIPILMTPR